MSLPALQLRTLYVLDHNGRLVSTREPGSRRPPVLAFVRGAESCAWALRSDVPDDRAAELGALLASELPRAELDTPPAHLDRYVELVAGRLESGPAFAFPDVLPATGDVVLIERAEQLGAGFPDLADELDARAPVLGVMDDDRAVSLCFCARRAEDAAEAGLQTLGSHRGRGHAARVTSAWAQALRASGRTPLYSTAWTNQASRAVAEKLGLVAYASDWNVYDEGTR